jgi:hypothetical protein
VPYKVGNYDGVKEQIRTLLDLATIAGIRESYLEALAKMAERLQNEPLAWGDPVYRKPNPVGLVCQGIVGPIIVRYSVHEPEHAVLIISIEPLFEWPVRP